MEHERIPVKTPNKNADIESYHRIFKDEWLKNNDFQTYEQACKTMNLFVEFYNKRRYIQVLNL